MTAEFTSLLDRLVARYGGAQKLAVAMGITLSAFQRGRAQGTYSTENCLRLAAAASEPPSEVLRAADKGAIADLIESLYGTKTISPADRQLLDLWAGLPPAARDTLLNLIDQLARQSTGGSPDEDRIRRRAGTPFHQARRRRDPK